MENGSIKIHAVGVFVAYHVTLTPSQGAEKHMTSRGGQPKRPPREVNLLLKVSDDIIKQTNALDFNDN